MSVFLGYSESFDASSDGVANHSAAALEIGSKVRGLPSSAAAAASSLVHCVHRTQQKEGHGRLFSGSQACSSLIQYYPDV